MFLKNKLLVIKVDHGTFIVVRKDVNYSITAVLGTHVCPFVAAYGSHLFICAQLINVEL